MNDPITPAPPATQTLTAPTVTPLVEPTTQADLTPVEASHMAEWAKQDLAKGKITAEQAEKIFTDLNTPLAQRAPDVRSDEERMMDKQFPMAKAEDFIIRYGLPGQELPMTPALKQFDQSARTWMSGAGLPRDMGNSLVNAIEKVAHTTKGISAEALDQYGTTEFAKLEKAHGAALEERLQAAARMVHDLDLKNPGLKNLLKSNGIGDNAIIANMLIAHAQIYHARRGAQGTR
jgi:hypothetical protein